MSEWKEQSLSVDFGKNTAKISWRTGKGVFAPSIHIHNLPFDKPGEQTQGETEAAVRREAKRALQELLNQL